MAVRDVSLEVRAGEVVALIGGNGAGKTTTLRAITGLLPLRRGRIEFAGERLDGLTPARVVARGIAHVPEGRQLFPTMTVRENLELGARGGEARARRAETLARVSSCFPVSRARAAVRGHAVGRRAADVRDRARSHGPPAPAAARRAEPGAGARGGEDDLRATSRHQRRGTTILLVEQNVARALALSHRAYVLENGRIALSGSASRCWPARTSSRRTWASEPPSPGPGPAPRMARSLHPYSPCPTRQVRPSMCLR